jgi:hypothetical protein
MFDQIKKISISVQGITFNAFMTSGIFKDQYILLNYMYL